jgi:TolB-like protein/class 3 adenylate cyclase
MAGYSRLIGLDDAGTLQRLRALRHNLIDPAIDEHGGRVVQTAGDSLLIVFDSIDGAVRCAVQVQQQVPDHDDGHPPDQKIRFRVGINIGDAIADGTDLHGEVVNVAARLQAECPPGGICVTLAVRDHVHDRLNLRFTALGAVNLKNIAHPIEAFVLRPDALESRSQPARVPLAPGAHDPLSFADKPSIAVLPFQNLSGDPEQKYFADGMVEEIITALSRIRWLFVIARNSSFTYEGRTVDVKQIGHELGVSYVLEGSVRKGRDSVRIAAQLIEAATGANLWAERFEGPQDDVFELQDRIAGSVAGVIEPTLEAAESRRSWRRPTSDLSAYDLYLRALPLHLSFEATQVIEAVALLGQAIERDPRFAPALGLAAWCHVQLETLGLADDIEANRRQGLDLARRAIHVAGEDATALVPATFALARFDEEIDPSIALISRALELNPSYARGWYVSGWVRLYAGQADVAMDHFTASLRLNPHDHAFPLYATGAALFFAGRFVEAAAKLAVAAEQLPTFATIHRLLAAAQAKMGRLNEAHATIARLRAITPVVVPRVTYWRDPAYRELLLSGLQLAAGT